MQVDGSKQVAGPDGVIVRWHPSCMVPAAADTSVAARKDDIMRTAILFGALLALLAVENGQARPRTGPHVRPVTSYTAAAPYEFVLEAGAVLPYGDLGDDFVGTAKGLGAGTGYEIGARFRYFATATLAVGPSFHYADFGDWEDVDPDEGFAYALRTSLYRYGLALQQFIGSDPAALRLYLTVEAALIHNRYEDWDQDLGTFWTSSNNLAVGAGLGLYLGRMELSAVYTHNPVENRQLPVAEGVEDRDFDWSYLAVRFGFAFGGF
jgi:hypothetical protein